MWSHVTVAGTDSQTTKPAPGRWSWLRRSWVSLILLAIGAGLAVWASVIYPTPETGIASPASSSLGIFATAPVGHVTYSVRQYPGDVAKLQVWVSSSPLPSAQVSAATATLDVALPPRFLFKVCPAVQCHNYTNGYSSTYSQSLVFGTGTASDTFWVKASKFGVNSDQVFAYAAIPQVNYQVTTGLETSLEAKGIFTVPTLQVLYRLRSASRYDWSSFPPAKLGNSSVGWQEALAKGDTAGLVAAGVSHKRQAQEANDTFVAGLLAGFAGGAVLAGLQGLLTAGK